MPDLEIIGAPWGNFVRTVRMACVEKGVPYTLNVVKPHEGLVAAIHPLGMVPCLRHGEVTLCESRAICTYIDMAFPGPPLVPADPVAAAVQEQWISLVLTTFDPVLARQYLVTYINAPGGTPAPEAVSAIMPRVRDCFGVLEQRLAAVPYLAGAAFSLADMFLFPLMWFMRLKPESAALLQGSPAIAAWYTRVAARESAVLTEPPAPTGPPAPCKV